MLCLHCLEAHEEADRCPHCGGEPGGASASLRHLPAGAVLAGRYTVGRAIGGGGFSVVYLARDEELKIRRAIKEFLPVEMAGRAAGSRLVEPVSREAEEPMRRAMERFLEEGRTVARVGQEAHGVTAFVRVFDAFRENDTAYLVMEYLKGRTLAQFLDAHGGRISWDLAMGVMEPVIAALDVLHRQGVLHRDVSADNILLTDDHYIKLIDFGAAREFAAAVSRSMELTLKAGYSPPEQYQTRGQPGPAADIYATAATLYLAITGRLPPEAPDRQSGAPLQSPRKLGARLPRHAERALLKALSLRESDRYQSMGAFLDALKRPQGPRDWLRARPGKRAAVLAGAVALGALAYHGALLRLRGAGEETFQRWYASSSVGTRTWDQIARDEATRARLEYTKRARAGAAARAEYARGMILHLNREPEPARESFERALALSPPDDRWFAALALNTLGRTHREMRRLRLAEEHYRRAAEANPQWAFPRLNLGSLYRDSKRLAAAEEEYRKAIAIDPRRGRAHFLLAELYYTTRRRDEACVEYRQALDSQSSPPLSQTDAAEARKKIQFVCR